MSDTDRPLRQALSFLFQSHPWHGVPFPKDPRVLTCYVEMVPVDTVKYELDKATGLLKVDRPQKYSSVSPTLYGFVPQTLCGPRVAGLCEERTGRRGIVGDGDPMDVCILTEREFSHGNVLVPAVPIGGLRMLDGEEADDKVVAVLEGDSVYGALRDIAQCPPRVVDRLRHYFLTYKQGPDEPARACEITHVYGPDEAADVVRRSHEDYVEHFAGLEGRLAAVLRGGLD
jgi:inorganic pyrophosphatase